MRKAKFYRRKFGDTFKLVLKIIVVLLILSGATYGVLRTDYFKVSGIKINGTKNFVNRTDLEELTKSRAQDKLIFTLNTTDLETSLEEDFQGAKNIEIKRKYPATIIVNVEERIPLAVIKDSSGNHFLVDEDGYVLGQVDPSKTNLPKVNYEKDIAVGYILEPELVDVFLSLLHALDDKKILINNLTVTQRYLSFNLNDNQTQVLISNEKDKEKSVEALNNLLEKLSSEGKEPSLIDLRYDKVVVSYR